MYTEENIKEIIANLLIEKTQRLHTVPEMTILKSHESASVKPTNRNNLVHGKKILEL